MENKSERSNTSYYKTATEKAQMRSLIDYSSVNSIPEIWSIAAQNFGQISALQDPHSKPEININYSKLNLMIQQFAAGLEASGLRISYRSGSLPPRVGLFADNSYRWLIVDQGIMTAGAANVVRGATADREELLYILEDSGCTSLAVENLALLQKLRPELDKLPMQLVVLLSDEKPPEIPGLKIKNFSEIMAAGTGMTLPLLRQDRETLATLLYTSGTTGKPKGVMLTHGNLLHQVINIGSIIAPNPGDRILSILPTWHAYERTGEYFLLAQGCTQIYTNLRAIKKDLRQFKPQYVISVPRLWESIYEGVQKQLREQPPNKQKLVNLFLSASKNYVENKRTWQGLELQPEPPALTERLLGAIKAGIFWPIHILGQKIAYKKICEAVGGELKYAVSGGGSMAMHLETFFESVGIEVLVGYGLTETAPVLTIRRPGRNMRGSAGQPIPDTEIKIVNPETRQTLPPGQRGLVLARGGQIMQGYYQKPEATAKAIDPEGWFDTGDLGWLSVNNDLVLTGRAKDTIVLTNGENIEPQPIEDACLRSPFIDQIMLVGQDRKSLGALIVPNLETLQAWAASQNLRLHLPDSVAHKINSETLPTDWPEIDLDSKPIQDLFRQELNREVQNRPGYRIDDRIGPFRLIIEQFSIENGLMTQTMKIKRNVVAERYHDIINGMF